MEEPEKNHDLNCLKSENTARKPPQKKFIKYLESRVFGSDAARLWGLYMT